MKTLKTKAGQEILVCDRDYELFKHMPWGIDSGGYPRTWVHVKIEKYKYKTKTVHLHRLIFNSNKNLVVDHINRNKLDNRRCNLRLVNRAINSINSSLHDNSSGVKKHKTKWCAYGTENDEYVHIGVYKTKALAIEARAKWLVGYKQRINM